MRRLQPVLFALCVVALSTVFMASAIAQGSSIKIGVLTVRTGPASPIGDDIVAGIQTATQMYGSVLGRPVELVIEDSLFNPQNSVTKATKLVQSNQVSAILGTSSIETLALLAVADRLGVPIITSNAGSPAAITRDKCNKWVFRTNAEDHMSIHSLQHMISQTPRLQNAKFLSPVLTQTGLLHLFRSPEGLQFRPGALK